MTDPKLDIWGSPTSGGAECFRCGIAYRIEESTAPEDYAATYCSHACYNEDMNAMLRHIERQPPLQPEASQEEASPAIKSFRMKVRRDEEQ